MAKFKALKKFFDKVNDKSVKEGEIIDITIKRSEEIEKNALQQKFEGPFLERIKEKK
ncbi:hypothetical protein [Staphylococcus chromogenes]|uniref:hypothetical protein n=1 Tax=Staphylococcus chromogenes TaxID=46126 RepID=UPI0015FE30F6|nr:hypothetical protein [Staphylococcus chromogenes]MCD9062746.1 hypothetical protein [Staphylococcus chromogenes]MCE4960581.1 hypothetical protein [Staphylococcus chromogenes]